jgi:gamma-glutamyltranspeptidase / glutathione hydrolase
MRWDLPYPSRRQPVLAANVVATSQPLAAQAGLAMLQRGGNAVDAAVAAAACLTVVEPTSNGIGGDAFAIVADGDRLHGLNASGPAPAAVDPERFAGRTTMPLRGWDTVTVPGAVAAWSALVERFGRLALVDLLAPAIHYARRGWPVGPVTADVWADAPEEFAGFPDFAAAFLPQGRAPRPGERFALPAQADTLMRIATSSARDFYEGELAERIDAHARATGGALRASDLAAFAPEWVEPLALDFAGARVHELPPNGQGIAALLALGILRHTDLADQPAGSPEATHLTIEAMKLAFAEAHRHVAEPAAMTHAPASLLADEHLAALARSIDPAAAADPGHGQPPPGGTVYLAAGDADGMAVSFIQSNYYGFGSGIVVPGTGIALQNRAAAFATDPAHPNALAPGKRPFHTIIPAFVTWPAGGDLALGVMGGPMQPQGHVQLLVRMLLAGESAQAAADAPRWRVDQGTAVALETGAQPALVAGLTARGHRIQPLEGMGGFGGAQVVQRLPTCWLAASDPRKEGQAVGW